MSVQLRRTARIGTLLLSSAALLFPLALAAQTAAANAGFINTLMPLPASLTAKSGSLRIDSSFSYAIHGPCCTRLNAGAVRLIDRLEMLTGIELAKKPAQGQDGTLTIDVLSPASSAYPTLDEDESYTLDIDSPHIALHAKTDIGALRGMETLLQLAQPEGSGFIFPAVHIEDAPRFPWRGLMLDAGRHFLPVDVIYRTLDGMAAVKLNVLHWHLTEDQGFRIESRVFPKLQSLGSNGLYYTQQQVRDVVAYASARGIRVVPEFDMPGHSTSWLVGYPSLGSAPGPYSVQTVFGIHDAALDPTRESTYTFLDAFLGEMAHLFPDAYMHVGGDESNGKQWAANPHIQAFMRAHGLTTSAQLQAYFNTRVQKILAKYHKRMVGWDEILSPNLPRSAVIQNWHGTEFLINAAKQGHNGIYSHPYYLDHMYTAAEVFLADPIPAGSDLTPEQTKLILGGEACMWGEHVSPLTIDSRIWPRAAAVAERFWSPASDRDTGDMYRRLAVESLRLDAEGLTHISHPERALRQLAGTQDDGALALFASTLEPVDFGQRYHEQRTSQLTPLDQLVDALRPDPPLRHEMELLVAAALKGDTDAMNQLQSIFRYWVYAATPLESLSMREPLLHEESERISEWPKLGQIGLDALTYLSNNAAPPEGWQAEQTATIQEAAKPQELINFVVLPPLQKLVDAAAALKPASTAAAPTDPIHAYLQALVEDHTIAGAVTLVADKDGVRYVQPVGFRDLAAQAPMAANDLFWIASVSKPLTVTAFMMLVDEGKINIDDPVEKYLPEFKGQKVCIQQPAPVPPPSAHPCATEPASHPILIREILSHTSGLPFHSAAQPGALDSLSVKDSVHSFAREPLLFQPGTKYSYSNEGIDTAARIIEVVSGMPYEQFLQQKLFDPLGMTDTTFWPTQAQIARLATSYKLDKSANSLQAMQIDQLTYPLDDHAHRFPMPAGGLFSTAADLARFCQMILNGGELDGKRYISRESLRRMTSTENGGLGGTDYGFGWAVSADGFGHGGAYKNTINIDTSTGRILVFMVQQNGPWGTPAGDGILSTLKQLANQIPALDAPSKP
ncbi:MAG: family 20 glycosylhydrolase [Terracidiphilus sp.]